MTSLNNTQVKCRLFNSKKRSASRQADSCRFCTITSDAWTHITFTTTSLRLISILSSHQHLGLPISLIYPDLPFNFFFRFSSYYPTTKTAQRKPGPLHSWRTQITHSDTPQSVGLLWKRDRPIAGTSTWEHTTLTRDTHPCPGGIRTSNPSKRAAAVPCLRPLGHWYRHSTYYTVYLYRSTCVKRKRVL